jgi:hypothetical protein
METITERLDALLEGQRRVLEGQEQMSAEFGLKLDGLDTRVSKLEQRASQQPSARPSTEEMRETLKAACSLLISLPDVRNPVADINDILDDVKSTIKTISGVQVHHTWRERTRPNTSSRVRLDFHSPGEADAALHGLRGARLDGIYVDLFLTKAERQVHRNVTEPVCWALRKDRRLKCRSEGNTIDIALATNPKTWRRFDAGFYTADDIQERRKSLTALQELLAEQVQQTFPDITQTARPAAQPAAQRQDHQQAAQQAAQQQQEEQQQQQQQEGDRLPSTIPGAEPDSPRVQLRTGLALVGSAGDTHMTEAGSSLGKRSEPPSPSSTVKQQEQARNYKAAASKANSTNDSGSGGRGSGLSDGSGGSSGRGSGLSGGSGGRGSGGAAPGSAGAAPGSSGRGRGRGGGQGPWGNATAPAPGAGGPAASTRSRTSQS